VTEYFISNPKQTEIKARIAEPRVRAVIKAKGLAFRQPVYIITKLKITKGFAGKRETKSRTTAAVEGGAPVPTPAGDITINAIISAEKDTEERDEWKAGGDIVFAYQLLKIKLKGWKTKRLEVNEFRHKATYLSLKDNNKNNKNDNDRNEKVAASVVTAPNLNAAGKNKVTTTVTVGDGNNSILIILFPNKN